MPSLLKSLERVPVESLTLYPGNPRIGNIPLIAESLRENHQYAPIVVQRGTRHVLAGNHTLQAAQLLGWPDIDVVFVDVDDGQARKIVLSSNRTADLGSYDNEALTELLAGLDGDLDGTGWTETELDRLLGPGDTASPADYDDDGADDEPLHTADLLAGTKDSYQEQYAVIVVCHSEDEQQNVFEQLTELGLACRVVTT